MKMLNRVQNATQRPVARSAPSVRPSMPGRVGLATLSPLLLAAPVQAAEEPVDSAVESVIAAIKAGGAAVKIGVSAVESGVQVLKEGYEVAAPVVQKAYQAASPVVEQALKAGADVAGPAFKAALPSIQDAGKALESTGLNGAAVGEATTVVTKTATTAITTASPFLIKFFQFLASSDPLTLGEYALGLVAFTYVAPALLGGLGGSFRGFAGELAAAACLDCLVNEGNVVLIDLRTAKEKEGSGIPDLPASAASKVLEVEYATTEDKKLRNALRDPTGIEAQITALQVASLKRINKGSKVVLLDRYGPAARTVAKELSRKGFGKVYVVEGGFDGRNGWVQSKLQIKPAATVVSSTPPSLAKTVFTRTRALPAPKA